VLRFFKGMVAAEMQLDVVVLVKWSAFFSPGSIASLKSHMPVFIFPLLIP
jgi:hypothetical protein